MTDRAAYVGYLEVQLERVTAACLAATACEYVSATLCVNFVCWSVTPAVPHAQHTTQGKSG